jgi:DNA-directed RNA polymerase subunit RPC12/RpoP
MPLLSPPHCPNCNSEIDLKELWRAAPKAGRSSRLDGKVGIVCPMCGIKLRVLDGRMQIASVVGFVLMLCISAAVGQLTRLYGDKNGSVIGLILIVLAFFIAFQRSIPKLLRVRPLGEGETVGFPLITQAENLARLREEADRDRVDLEEAPDTGPAWKCPKCGEESPGNFNECWNCLAMRPEAGSISGSAPP